jgi:hypothetical protein
LSISYLDTPHQSKVDICRHGVLYSLKRDVFALRQSLG